MSTVEDHLRYMDSIEHMSIEPNGDHASSAEMYVAPSSLLTADTGITPDMPKLVERVRRSEPADIAMAVLEEVGIAPDPGIVQTYRTETQELWTSTAGNIPTDKKEAFDRKSEIIRHADLLAERVRMADAFQRSLWEDYKKRTGQNVDKVMELYDDTDAFKDSSVLKTVTSLDFRLHSDDRVKDAERILRYMIRGEARAETQA